MDVHHHEPDQPMTAFDGGAQRSDSRMARGPDSPAVDPHVLARIRELARRRNDVLGAEGNLTRKLRAICRSSLPLQEGMPLKAIKQAADALYDQAHRYLSSQTKWHRKTDELNTRLIGATDAKTERALRKRLDAHLTKRPVPDDDLAGLLAGALLPIWQAREMLKDTRAAYECELDAEVHQLPVWQWAGQLYGIKEISIALIVGAAGDLSHYPTHQKLAMRMGAGIVDGVRQGLIREVDDDGKVKLRAVRTGEEAQRHGYSPKRRAILAGTVGNNLIRKASPYRIYYDQRKARLKARETPPPSVDKSAKRYTQKQFLRHLWVVWRAYERNDRRIIDNPPPHPHGED